MLENLRNATKSRKMPQNLEKCYKIWDKSRQYYKIQKNSTKSTKNATKFGTILEIVTKYRKMLENLENATISIKMLEYL